ncbi:very long-chain specific acyl-CoA dehydrogenase, mitochondrial isoform X2 [Eurosta solidaginis]|uniref:very long-chain specific acyl-CoA dehydrogenase, mitochondrial isoform X2 n=1 Tax=Eurosta solidaginis TaxID=178769 RepID=UPI00353146CC
MLSRSNLATARLPRLTKRYFTAQRNTNAMELKSGIKALPSKKSASFMLNLFRGKFVSEEVFPYPDVLADEQKELITSLVTPFEKFFSEVNNAARNDETSLIDKEIMDQLWDLGAFGIQVPEEYGGLGLSNTQYGIFCEILGGSDLGIGITLGAHQSIGFKGILLFGTQKQKQKYLPMLATGKVYAAFALTEPSSGSDAASIKTRAVKSDDGNYFILNGSKIWISNGGIAEVMTVFAQTEHIDSKTGEKKDKVTAFIVERSFGGVTSGPPEKKMGIKASNTTEVYFENVSIPVENVLGEEGEGFKVAMMILNNGRFGMGATLSGTMKVCIQKAVDHSNSRVQFGKKIREYGAIQEKISQMNILQYATETMAYAISQNMDKGSKEYHLEAAISKIFASESAWYVCDEAIQILGGMGYMKGAGLERILRDLRIFRIFEGTNDILRLFVALTGIQYAASNLKELRSALKNPITNIKLLSGEISSRISRSIGLGQIDFTPYVAVELQRYSKGTAACIEMFGKTVEGLLLKYGKSIVNEQFILNRLANAAIDVYAMTVTLSRSTRALNLRLPTAQHEINLTKALCIQTNNISLQCANTNISNDENGESAQTLLPHKEINSDYLVCKNGDEPSGAHMCISCSKAVHAIEPCSYGCGEEGYGQKRVCQECFKENTFSNVLASRCEENWMGLGAEKYPTGFYLGSNKEKVKAALNWKIHAALHILKNGSDPDLQAIHIDGSNVSLLNTCAFDAICQVMLGACFNNSMLMEKVMRKEGTVPFFNFIKDILTKGATSGMYKKRGTILSNCCEILYRHKNLNTLNCEVTVTWLAQQLFKDCPTLKESTECTEGCVRKTNIPVKRMPLTVATFKYNKV